MPERYVTAKHFDQRIDLFDNKIDKKISELASVMMTGFAETRRGFTEVDKRFNGVHQELEDLAIMTKNGFDEMNERFTRVDRYMLLDIEQLKMRVDRIEKALLLSVK